MLLNNINSVSTIVRQKDSVLFEGYVTSVSSWNEKGTFDVLPQHANFVAVIKKTVTVRPIDKAPIIFTLTRGIIHVKQNNVEVFIGV